MKNVLEHILRHDAVFDTLHQVQELAQLAFPAITAFDISVKSLERSARASRAPVINGGIGLLFLFSFTRDESIGSVSFRVGLTSAVWWLSAWRICERHEASQVPLSSCAEETSTE